MVYQWRVISRVSMEIIRERLPRRPERPLWILCFCIARQNHTTEEREQGKDILNLVFQCTICGQILLLSTLILKQGPGICYSKFREISIEDLSDISFRKALVDTCQLCDRYQKKMKPEAVGSRLQQYAEEQQRHLLESEVRFASLKYDVIILAKTWNRDEAD